MDRRGPGVRYGNDAVSHQRDGDGVSDTIRSVYVDHDGVRLHYLDSGGLDSGGLDSGGPASAAPLVFVPGMGDDADEFDHLLADLLPRRVLAVDLRGRGRSEVPDGGWGLAEHVADLAVVIGHAGIGRTHIASYSRGTSYAVGWAIGHADQVLSVAIGDYGARQVKVPEDHWASWGKRRWRGRAGDERMDARAILGVFTEGEAIDLFDDLGALGVPVLVMHGTERDAMVTPELLARYRAHVPNVETVAFAGSGHNLWRPDPHRFAATLADFLARVDAALPADGG
jgi:pimeloyl-ACP methyl ester carboxylesterase